MSLSDSSDLSSGETVYTLDDLRKMNIIGEEVAEWIKKNPLPPDDPLLCLQYQNQQVATRSNEIYLALVQNQAVPVTSAVFQFAKKDHINTARENMRQTHTWAFYHRRGILVPGQHLNQQAQWVLLPQDVSISTKLIHFFSPSKFTIENEYDFFEY